MTLEEREKKRKEKRKEINTSAETTLNNMQKIIDEDFRVANVAHNAETIIENLDKEFEEKTGLRGNDITFLFAAIGLQITRIVVHNELTKQAPAGKGNKKEDALHRFQQKLLSQFNANGDSADKPYHASTEHIITRLGVPYDATEFLTEDSIKKLLLKDREFGFDIDTFKLEKSLPLFKGANHRFSTLGHDPIAGLLFGTGNIMTNTISCVEKPVIANGVEIPVLTTNHVVYTSDYRDPRIATYASTVAMFSHAVERTMDHPSAFVAALLKQIIHIGTDLYTPCGIQIPGANLVLSNSNVEKVTKYIGAGEIVKIGTSAKLASLINILISALHTLMYDESMMISRELYNVKTRKIIDLSNVIATGSNVIWVAGNMAAGNEGVVKQLDIGGLLETTKRLITDTEFIRQIKEEYVLGGFRNMIQGKDLELEETIWDSKD